MLEVDRFTWRYLKVKEDLQDLEPGAIITPYSSWWNNFNIKQKLSNDGKSVIRTTIYHNVRSLKDQARQVEKINRQNQRELNRIKRYISLGKKYQLGYSTTEWLRIFNKDKIEADKLPVLTI